MLAPTEGSTNTDPPSSLDKTPLVSDRIYRRISGMFSPSSAPRSTSQGYVEFGSITEPSETRTLGTFAGVFSPVTLSMFSALIFLRVGYVVGNAGLIVTLCQFVIAYAILLFTVASVCAISTNGAVEGGGAYFMISRTLGPDFGGSIGTLFFLANVVNSALNIAGCVEGLVENFGPSGYLIGEGNELIPDTRWYRFLYCTALNTLNLLVCLIGAAMFAKTSVVILGVVTFCLGTTFLSFFIQKAAQIPIPDTNDLIQNSTYHAYGIYTGLSTETLTANLWPKYGQDYTSHDGEMINFASVFGVLFSGVTGIMAGANMSGELKNPSKNIPNGTLTAMLFTFIVYITVSILTAATCTRYLLHNDFLFMIATNFWPVSVAVGLITATLSASLSNLIGSSRVLEALAKDQVFGSFLDFVTKGTWRGNPIIAVLTSWLLVQIILFIGSLNIIAQINSVLFLLSYLATNMACLGLELASAPNFRPTFKYFTWHTAFLGLIGTLVMMFVINPVYAACSIVLCLVLVVFLHLFSPSKEAHWGSISQALIFHQVRKYLLMLDSRKDHVKFWRPQILLMVSNPRTTCPLIDFINDLKKGGLYVLGHVKIGNTFTQTQDPTIQEYTHWLSLVDHLRVKAFIELTVASSVREGFQHLVRISGMGAMKPNTIVLGFQDTEQGFDFFQSESSQYFTTSFESSLGLFPLRMANQKQHISTHEYVSMIGDTLRMHKNICLCRNFSRLDKKAVAKNSAIKYIDVWPLNFFQPAEQDIFDTTSLFMMQLACIVNMVPTWKRLQLRICLCDDARTSSFQVNESRETRAIDVRLKHMLKMLRITAVIYPIQSWSGVVDHLRGRSVMYSRADMEGSLNDVNRTYLTSVNTLIKQHSSDTAVTFIYLPAPPAIRVEEEELIYPQYLQMLTDITQDLPATILVHGMNTVTSTTL